MNEFTKEELKYLLERIESILIVSRSVNDELLQEKLQSMIDNYIEKETTESKTTVMSFRELREAMDFY